MEFVRCKYLYLRGKPVGHFLSKAQLPTARSASVKLKQINPQSYPQILWTTPGRPLVAVKSFLNAMSTNGRFRSPCGMRQRVSQWTQGRAFCLSSINLEIASQTWITLSLKGSRTNAMCRSATSRERSLKRWIQFHPLTPTFHTWTSLWKAGRG